MMAALEKGNAEIMGYYVDGKQGKRLDALPHLKMVDTPNQGLVEIRPNFKMKPFDDPAFRRAFQHAINRKAILEIALDGCGTICQNTPIHPLIKPWHDPDATTPEFDLEKARAILKSAGYTWDEKGKLHSPR